MATCLAEAAHNTNMMWTAAVIAWVLAVPLWFVTKFLVVIAHEGGHALVGTVLFHGVKRVTFGRDGGGGTEFSSRVWPFFIIILFAGYAGPSLFGLLAAALLLHGAAPETVLWASAGFLAVMMFTVRGLIGWIVGPLLLVVLYEVATHGTHEQRALAAYVWTWFLLIGAVQRMLVYLSTKNYLGKATDTYQMQTMTLIPSEIWSLVLLLGTSAALVWGGSMLLRMPA